ncbi:GvpL/GvpF family gas vesicle protein [Streptomyces sp. 142MFCol3.1]|uniref:GvpL/GvpF family gas vesicle protein n=1 Tax=Streptomyces sp. 142MFCol3.1 TaxID=1172179 RepID=UPI0003F6DDF5|nr:GvpL/GvpF family gas vesicle protein [Streptomyces sp. 142MFCol3.1]
MTDPRYVYAVCSPLDTPLVAQPAGVAGVAPRPIHHAGLTAIVSDVPAGQFSESALRQSLEDLDWLAETARAHQTVIAALTTVTSPLPLRLATVFRDDSGVCTMLEEEGTRLRASLERIRDRVEWGVKVYVDDPPIETGGAGTHGGAALPGERSRVAAEALAAGAGRDYLRRRRAERAGRDDMWRRAETFAQRLHDQLGQHAQETRLHPPQNPQLARTSGRNVLNAAYLVDGSKSESFMKSVEAGKDDRPGLRVELTGPWAAYSFSTPPEERVHETQPVTGEAR